MAVELEIFDIGILEAYADKSLYQHHFMKLSGVDFQFNLCGAGEVPVGILQNIIVTVNNTNGNPHFSGCSHNGFTPNHIVRMNSIIRTVIL